MLFVLLSYHQKGEAQLPERLEYIFGNINEQLRFAENKNKYIISVSFGTITAVLFFEQYFTGTIGVIFLTNFFVMIFCSLICSVLSFHSKFAIFDDLQKKLSRSEKENNIVFFGHISNMDVEDFLNRLGYDLSDNYNKSIAHQIIINARIARRKFTMFNISLWFFIAALLTPIGSYLLVNLLSDEKL